MTGNGGNHKELWHWQGTVTLANTLVIPAQAGNHASSEHITLFEGWIPACAGMTRDGGNDREWW